MLFLESLTEKEMNNIVLPYIEMCPDGCGSPGIKRRKQKAREIFMSLNNSQKNDLLENVNHFMSILENDDFFPEHLTGTPIILPLSVYKSQINDR